MTTPTTHLSIESGVAVLEFDNPPNNRLAPAMLAAFSDALAKVQQNRGVPGGEQDAGAGGIQGLRCARGHAVWVHRMARTGSAKGFPLRY
jgi:hypothetical protein